MTSGICRPKTSIVGPKGITAKAQSAVTIASAGARMKIGLCASAGMMSSFMMNLMPSAIGWNSPSGPTRFGPQRYWITADSRRSTQVMIATPTISALITTTILTSADDRQ